MIFRSEKTEVNTSSEFELSVTIADTDKVFSVNGMKKSNGEKSGQKFSKLTFSSFLFKKKDPFKLWSHDEKTRLHSSTSLDDYRGFDHESSKK